MAKQNAICEVLNRLAERYQDADEVADKRDFLRTYLECLAMAAISDYPWSTLKGEAPRLNLRPISELREHLLGLDYGEAPELFAVAKRPGRPTNRRKQFFWAHAAALIDVLMGRFGKSEDQAASDVAEQLRIRGLLGTDSPRADSPAWKLLQSWRDKIRNGEKGKMARAWYEDALLFAAFYDGERDLYNGLLNPARLPREPLSGNTA